MTASYERHHNGSILEETLIHEGAHTSIDGHVYGTEMWKNAVEADGKYISNYARDHPYREDIAETYLVWFATRCSKETFTTEKLAEWEREMGARFGVFDEISLKEDNMSPYTNCSAP